MIEEGYLAAIGGDGLAPDPPNLPIDRTSRRTAHRSAQEKRLAAERTTACVPDWPRG